MKIWEFMHPRLATVVQWTSSAVQALLQKKRTRTLAQPPAFRLFIRNCGANASFRRMRSTLNGVAGAFVLSDLSAFRESSG
jgi:hypothetical protein